MKRIYWLAPCIATTLFAVYYNGWSKERDVCYRPKVIGHLYDEYEGRDGRAAAEAAWAHGTPMFLTYGLPPVWSEEFAEILKRDYGVTEFTAAGCMVTAPLLKYVATYNAVTTEHLRTIYGPDVMKEAVRKAEALYAERHPPLTPPGS